MSSLSHQEIQLVYVSTSKTHAIEDCIKFSPQLFRINHSIIVSEPTSKFMSFLKNQAYDDHRKKIVY